MKITAEWLEDWAEAEEWLARILGPPDTPHEEADQYQKVSILRKLAKLAREDDDDLAWGTTGETVRWLLDVDDG